MAQNDEKISGGRWWEFYLVRYLVGTVIGAMIVLFLAANGGTVSTDRDGLATVFQALKSKDSWPGNIAILAALGFVFCYVASAPILVLHAVRGFFHRGDSRKVRVCRRRVVVVMIALFALLLVWRVPDSNSCIVKLLVYAIFIGQLSLLFLALFECRIFECRIFECRIFECRIFECRIFECRIFECRIFEWLIPKWRIFEWLTFERRIIFEYYDQLVKWRSAANETGNEYRKEYIESYRHLREHGNAFLIVLLELLLGAFLSYHPMSQWTIILALWIFPAALVWLFGTLLESRISQTPCRLS